MYSLMIVDDEEIEREGMAQFIPWKNYGIELIATAWNGVDAIEKMQNRKPDIILTDIKMPIMDGITLIRKTKEFFKDIEFIVLSGYGEFEYTSQAMREGIRHYLLKPCDEEKIAHVIDRVTKEIEEKRRRVDDEKAYMSTVHRLLPRAKEQVFRNMLLGKEQLLNDYEMVLEEVGDNCTKVHVLAIVLDRDIDYLDQFIVSNILHELMKDKGIVLETSIDREVYFLIDHKQRGYMDGIMSKFEQEIEKLQLYMKNALISKAGDFEEIGLLYEQIKDIMHMSNGEHSSTLLTEEAVRDVKALEFLDYKELSGANTYVDILFIIYLMFVKMSLKQLSYEEKHAICGWVQKAINGNEIESDCDNDEQDECLLMWSLVEKITSNKGLETLCGGQRFKKMLLETFRYLGEQKLSIQFLAKEILFMNEDYFGRFFMKHQGQRFTKFLLEQRIKLAKEIMVFMPDIKITQLAKLVGYPEDGQYFSKNFRKISGLSPMEYRDSIHE